MRITIARTTLCLVGLLFCLSCSASDSTSPVGSTFEGSWGLASFDSETGIRVYSKLDALEGDQDGYLFEAGGKLMVRNFGWCATPPLSYANFAGSWVEETKNNLVLSYSHLGEMRDFRLTIVFLGDEEMRCRVDIVE